jgi:putative transcriptional regulator
MKNENISYKSNEINAEQSFSGDFLTGSFLVSTSKMPDPRFEAHVIYICAHSENGAMGVAINQPNDAISFGEILEGAQLPILSSELPPVYIGGPVELESAFILYKNSYQAENRLDVSSTVSLTRETKVLKDIAMGCGPKDYLFILGYSGWGPGQLERELVDRGWLNVPGNDDIIFNIPNDRKWKAAAMQYGIDIETFDDNVGFA